MTEEEKIKLDLEGRFDYLKDGIRIQRNGRIFADAALERFEEVFDYTVKKLGFAKLSTITGLDERDRFSVIYHLARGGIVLSLKTSVNRENPEAKTVTPYFPDADIYEREIADLLGIKFAGLAEGQRYPLPDNWPEGEYPLRKDWKGGIQKKEVADA